MLRQKFLIWMLLVGWVVTTSCGPAAPSATPMPVPLESLKTQAAQVFIKLEDLPDQFTEYLPDDGRMLGEDSLFDVQNEFSFRTEVDNLQTIIGMTTIYPYTQRDATAGIDRIRSQLDVLARSITKGYTISRNVDVDELMLDAPVGDAYSGRTFNESLDDLGYPEYHTRTQILVFERNKITAILLFQFVEELPLLISIQDAAEILDQRILALDT